MGMETGFIGCKTLDPVVSAPKKVLPIATDSMNIVDLSTTK